MVNSFAVSLHVATLKDGICYICPVTSAWPNLMRDGGKEATIALEEYVFRDGKLVYESWETAKPILTKDREQGIYTEQYALKYDVIKEIRIGTQDDYTVAYREGDKIPLYTMGE